MNTKRFWIFTLQAAVATLGLFIAMFIDQCTNNYSIAATLLKIVYCMCLLLYFSKHEGELLAEQRKGSQNIWIQFVILAVINILPSFRILNKWPDWEKPLLYAFTIGVTCLWDELFFRLYATFFALKGKGAMKDIMLLSVVYALTKLLDLFSGDFVSAITNVIFSFGLGVLLFTMLFRKRSFTFGFLLHFVILLTNMLFSLFSDRGLLLGMWSIAVYIFLSVFCIFLADLNLSRKRK